MLTYYYVHLGSLFVRMRFTNITHKTIKVGTYHWGKKSRYVLLQKHGKDATVNIIFQVGREVRSWIKQRKINRTVNF